MAHPIVDDDELGVSPFFLCCLWAGGHLPYDTRGLASGDVAAS